MSCADLRKIKCVCCPNILSDQYLQEISRRQAVFHEKERFRSNENDDICRFIIRFK